MGGGGGGGRRRINRKDPQISPENEKEMVFSDIFGSSN